jgi:hypothetical protein
MALPKEDTAAAAVRVHRRHIWPQSARNGTRENGRAARQRKPGHDPTIALVGLQASNLTACIVSG